MPPASGTSAAYKVEVEGAYAAPCSGNRGAQPPPPPRAAASSLGGVLRVEHESSGVLITGDSIFNIASRRSWPLAAFCTSYAQSKATAALLADLEYGIAALSLRSFSLRICPEKATSLSTTNLAPGSTTNRGASNRLNS
jgi:hypothetical protein